MFNLTLSELSQALSRGDFSSLELTQALLDRIQRLDTTYNSFITLSEEQALEQAKAADALRAAGKATALTGLPIAHKDLFCTQGIRTS